MPANPSRSMLTFHVGLPKTATTAAQRVLSRSTETLSAAGIDYVDILRNREGIAHHSLPAELLERRDADGPHARALVDRVKRTSARHTIVSSEALTNVIASPRRMVFVDLLAEIAQVMPVRVVIVLRRVDDFFTSMYLQSAKVGEVTSPIEAYLSTRTMWSRGLFTGLRTIRRSPFEPSICVVKYEPGPAFLGRILGQIIGDARLLTSEELSGRESGRLTTKAHAVLLNLDLVEERIGYSLKRFPLIRAMELGKLVFEDDTKSFSLLPRDEAEAIHRAALDAAQEAGENHYARYFRTSVIKEKTLVSLAPDVLSDADIEAVAQYAKRTNQPTR
ncbi:MAG: hypothetical protein AAGF49_12310 [Pseudomonadota bacterium]